MWLTCAVTLCAADLTEVCCGQASRVNMTAPEVVIGTSAVVDVSGRGSVGGVGAGAEGAGGSFGGSGGLPTCGDSSVPYYAADGVVGDIDVCDLLMVGSGGGAAGGRGGGGVWISGDSVTVGGAILADGGRSNTTGAGSGSGGAVCLQADSVVVLGKVSAVGGTSSSAGSGNGGGGRVTLKYCDLTEVDISHVDCHGGDDHGVCVNGGAGTRYDRQECSDDEASGVQHMVRIDNQKIETRALTLFDNEATVPPGVVLSELTIANSAAVGTRRLTVVAGASGTGLLELDDGCTLVAAPADVLGSWSSDDAETVAVTATDMRILGSEITSPNVVVHVAKDVEMVASHISSDDVVVEAANLIEMDGDSSISFSVAAVMDAGGELDVMVRAEMQFIAL